MFNNCIEDLCSVRKVRLLTHCNILPHIAGCMDIKLWLYIRCIKLIKMVCNSKNDVVITIAMGVGVTQSSVGIKDI